MAAQVCYETQPDDNNSIDNSLPDVGIGQVFTVDCTSQIDEIEVSIKSFAGTNPPATVTVDFEIRELLPGEDWLTGISRFSLTGQVLNTGQLNSFTVSPAVSVEAGKSYAFLISNARALVGRNNTTTNPDPYTGGDAFLFINLPPLIQAVSTVFGGDLYFNIIIPDESLPVELLDFSGYPQDGSVLLKWSTATETNNSHFEVEHSTDGRTFETIGEVMGAGDSQEQVDYSFLDEKPVRGTNYYRLRQVDFDGAFEYSQVITVRLDPGDLPDIVLFPNPTSGDVEVRIPDELLEEKLDLLIHDLAGKVVKREMLPVGERSVTIMLDDLPAGYFSLTVTDGRQQYTKKLITKK